MMTGGRVVTWNQFSTLIMRYGRIVKMMKAVTARASRRPSTSPGRRGRRSQAQRRWYKWSGTPPCQLTFRLASHTRKHHESFCKWQKQSEYVGIVCMLTLLMF